MAKDPAVLWYWNDWSGGTMTLSRFLKGCYMDLLTAQFNNGHLSLDEIKTVLGSDFGSSWPTLQKKFKTDENGLYYNERLLFEATKRKNFSKKQTERINKRYQNSTNDIGTTNNENEIVNENTIEFRKIEFIEKATAEISTNDIALLNDFIDYWTEGDGKKMRFELEKVFESKRRFKTFESNKNKWNKDSKSKTSELISTAERVKQQFANESDN